MKHTIYKLFMAWQHENEEKWLNEMSEKGLQLVSVGFCKYTFEEGNRGEYTYRIELLEHLPSHSQSKAYISFLEDTDIEHIGSLIRWVYFRKKSNVGEFNIYSDLDSKIKHFNRIRALLIVIGSTNIFPFLNNTFHYFKSGIIALLLISLVHLLALILFCTGVTIITKKIGKLKKEKKLIE